MYEYQSIIRGNYNEIVEIYNVDDSTKSRWMVNYIRHNLTEYDYDLNDIQGRVGCDDEYSYYKNAVLDKIAEVYPELKAECQLQKCKSKR